MTVKRCIPFFVSVLMMIAGSVTAQVTEVVKGDSSAGNSGVAPVVVQDTSTLSSVVIKRKRTGSGTGDTTVVKVHSPKRATLYSMVLPGLGQAYNRKYWKIPVIYTGIGGLLYMGIQNGNEYQKWHEAYLYKVNQYTYPINNELIDKYDAAQLKSQSDYYRRNMELTYILGSLLYILNLVDATVDAHLFNYDISDDLSLRFIQTPQEQQVLTPHFTQPLPPVQGLTFTWRF